MKDFILTLVTQVLDVLKGTGGADIFTIISGLLTQILSQANTKN